MLGLADELSLLRAAAERTSGGNVERWTIVAPPGAGKSRLLDELHRSMGTEQALVQRLQLGPDLAGPYQPVADLIRLSLDDQTPAAARLVEAGVSAERAEVLARELQALMTPAAADPERLHPPLVADSRVERFDAWLEALDALAGPRHQIWLVEDVHWASADFLAFLARAGGARSPAGRLIVATARPALLDRVEGWVDDDQRLHEARRPFALEVEGPASTAARGGLAAASVAASRLLLEQLRFREGAALAAESLRLIRGDEDSAAARLQLARGMG